MSKKHKAHKQDLSPKVVQQDKIKDSIIVKDLPWTPRQKQLIDLILSKENQIIFVSGPAGSSKSILAAYCALRLIADKKLSRLLYVRSVIESASKSLGALPGLASEKFEPYLLPLEDKLDELLSKTDKNFLFNDGRITSIPINFLRGASLNVNYIWGEEVQNMTFNELKTLITRFGKYSKMVLTGDFSQSDIGDKSGFVKMFNMFDNEESRAKGIHCFQFTKDDIMRSGILKYVLEVIEKHSL